MKYRIIILVFLNCAVTCVMAQDLEQVVPPQKSEHEILPNSTTDTFTSDLSNNPEQTESELEDIEDRVTRSPESYKKREYLNKILRQTYYQKISTPSWTKFFAPNIWRKNVLKWRYWNQVKNYITGNDDELIEIRSRATSVTTATVAEADDTVRAELNKDSLISALVSIAEQVNNENEANNQEDNLTETNPKPDQEQILIIQEPVKEEPVPAKVTIQKQPKKSADKTVDNNNKPAPQGRPSTTSEKVQKSPPVVHQTKASVSLSRTTLNQLFRKQKGFLPWPVAGRVTDSFGTRRNAQARGLKPENYGTDMLCPPGTSVRAVHDGTVIMAMRQSPYDYIVTLKHGDYSTAYFFLINTNLKPGDEIIKGQVLGQLRSGVHEADFHFEIWDNQNRVNPETWLQKNR